MKDDSGPAFPSSIGNIPEGHYATAPDGMSLRDWACVTLRVPETDKPWLNDLIEKSRELQTKTQLYR
ncbi:hypothetical protein LCGC14_2984320 [marine sediment metagenome]|uniref:Uncharacterized protein n=1 Tax=marine sediment metagenome TaxID=412755 RepID=A0A0F8X5Q2_9ZZZZ